MVGEGLCEVDIVDGNFVIEGLSGMMHGMVLERISTLRDGYAGTVLCGVWSVHG